ncbi:hypothetical protein RJ44_04575 [Alteromonas macleodii]|uniref:Stf0 family sulfotransferase n=1 Tax=Alteromonas macleodii TaxID=28108 RepID=UPI00057F76CE|nr:Stf0 family sulfotransferase [Alteromonas macleodii]KHT60318.1 hypothetical protein RJ44_04575 [Alteromonas macleodii]
MEIKYLKCNQIDVAYAKKRIPQEDLISESWDTEKVNFPKKLIVLLSTPRSGSTYLCHKLIENKTCVAHEYFQPFEYMLIAGDRWGCHDLDGINLVKYVKQLINKRTTDNGILGVNLHGHHLPYFESVLNLLPFSDISYIHLERREKLSQAISYEIASQSNNWSSQFKNDAELKYSSVNIRAKMNRLCDINRQIKLFLKKNKINAQHVFFEDILDGTVELSSLTGQHEPFNAEFPKINLERQSSLINKEWARRYSKENYINGLVTFIKSRLR